MAKEYSREIVEKIRDFFEENDWNFQFEEDTGLFRFGLNLNGKIRSIKYVVDVKKSDFAAFVFPQLNINPKDMQVTYHMLRFLCMVNYRLRDGNFDLDLSDGEIRYRAYVECENMEVSGEAIAAMISTVANAFETFGKGILQIMYADKTAEEAMQMCLKAADPVQEETNETDSSVSDLLSFLEQMSQNEE